MTGAPRRGRLAALLLLCLALLLGAGCTADLLNPPRLATAVAQQGTPRPAAEPVYISAPTATANPAGDVFSPPVEAPQLNVWLNETSPEHRAFAEEMARDFTERTGVDLAVQLVSSPLLPDLVHTAVLSGTLPDVILHPVEYSMAWSEAGILDPEVSAAIVEQLGRDTFEADALALVDEDGRPAAIPSHGYQQLLLYRADWFDEQQLAPPDSYATMLRGAERIFDPENITSGVVIPTESNLITTQRAFEQIALANGCQLTDESGEVTLLEPACREALDFYFSLINQYSPPGVQTDTSARNAFLDGRTGMIMTTPSILPDLVRANRLENSTGIITAVSGDDAGTGPVNLGIITYLGITPAADPAAAEAFASYWFNEGYQNWLAIESERKVPMRLGTADRPRFYIDAWGSEPVLEGESLTDIFGPAVVAQLRDGIAASPRWGLSTGQGDLSGQTYEKLTFSVVLQEMLSGYFNTEKTIFEAYNRVIELIPDYAFPVVPTPEPT